MGRIVQQELRMARTIESELMVEPSEFAANLRRDRVLVFATSIAHFSGRTEDELRQLVAAIRSGELGRVNWIVEILPIANALADRQAVEIPEHLQDAVREAQRRIYPVELNLTRS